METRKLLIWENILIKIPYAVAMVPWRSWQNNLSYQIIPR